MEFWVLMKAKSRKISLVIRKYVVFSFRSAFKEVTVGGENGGGCLKMASRDTEFKVLSHCEQISCDFEDDGRHESCVARYSS